MRPVEEHQPDPGPPQARDQLRQLLVRPQESPERVGIEVGAGDHRTVEVEDSAVADHQHPGVGRGVLVDPALGRMDVELPVEIALGLLVAEGDAAWPVLAHDPQHLGEVDPQQHRQRGADPPLRPPPPELREPGADRQGGRQQQRREGPHRRMVEDGDRQIDRGNDRQRPRAAPVTDAPGEPEDQAGGEQRSQALVEQVGPPEVALARPESAPRKPTRSGRRRATDSRG